MALHSPSGGTVLPAVPVVPCYSDSAHRLIVPRSQSSLLTLPRKSLLGAHVTPDCMRKLKAFINKLRSYAILLGGSENYFMF